MGVPTHVYCRVIGNAIGLALHTGNVIAMYFALQGDIVNDPDIKMLKATQLKYITIWNMAFQMVFLFVNLICDLPIVRQTNEEPKCMEHIRRYNNIFFSSVVWPLSVMIFAIFWPVFTTNRELIFPAFIDKALSLTSNHIMHSSILPIVLWELVFQPRSRPSSHKWYLAHIAFIYVSYLIVILANYAKTGLWPYPFLYMLYGTPLFPLFLISIGILYLGTYYIQWPLSEFIHGKQNKTEKIR